MQETDWTLVQDLFEQGLSLGPQPRTELLGKRCAQRHDLQAQVERLWRHDDSHNFDFEGMHRLAGNFSRVAREKCLRDSNHDILEPIAEGGMGVVYKARQQGSKRLVALKVLLNGLASPHLYRRFLHEQEILASLFHPNVATLLEASITSEDQPYFTMEYLGPMLTDYCDQGKLSIGQRLALFSQVCAGVSPAHEKGFFHCDIKPANVLVGEHACMAIPKIIDFGIARSRTFGHGFQAEKTILGTPGYMTPEQAAGNARSFLDPRTDIYSLGALLYYLLVGEAPFQDQLTHPHTHSLHEQLKMIRQNRPARPSERLKEAYGQNGLCKNRRASPSNSVPSSPWTWTVS